MVKSSKTAVVSRRGWPRAIVFVFVVTGIAGCGQPRTIMNPVAFAPEVPPPVGRRTSAVVHVDLNATLHDISPGPGVRYRAWTFNDRVPGPFIRAREGDTLEVTIRNTDPKMPHNLDFHGVSGPGGGAAVTTVVPGEQRTARFKLLYPGLFLYHCGASPVMDHIANGMYGLLLVEPKGGLPRVDREYYVLQSEFYTTAPAPGSGLVQYSHEDGLREDPRYIVFNGGAYMMNETALRATVGKTVRFFFGNAGPNKVSSFHVIGAILERVYREGDLVSEPARSIQTTLVPPGGATVVELTPEVPGVYTFVDHAIFRIEKGAMGMLRAEGAARPGVYEGVETPIGRDMSTHGR